MALHNTGARSRLQNYQSEDVTICSCWIMIAFGVVEQATALPSSTSAPCGGIDAGGKGTTVIIDLMFLVASRFQGQ